MKRTWTAFICVLLAVPALPAFAGGDEHSKTVDEMLSTLKNAATAQESYRTESPGYTRKVGRLKREGLRYDERNMDLFVSWADRVGYCMEVRHEDVVKPRHYDSSVGRPTIGRCPDHRRAKENWRGQVEKTLQNTAVAEESYATTNDGHYTDRISDLVAEGWSKVSREIRVSISLLEEDNRFCAEAKHDRLSVTWRYDSSVGSSEKGKCEA